MAEPADTANGATGYYVNVDHYYDELHHTTWARRTAGMLAGATLGAIYGGIIGAAASFIPYLMGVAGVASVAATLPGLGVIGASAALFATMAAGTGMLITADVAASAASSAVGLEEEGLQPAPAKTKNGETKAPPFFSWKIAAIGAALFAAFGALLALNPSTSITILKETAFKALEGHTAAAVAASAMVSGMFGSLLGMRNSALTNSLCNFYYKVVTGHIFNKEHQQETTVQPQLAPLQENAIAQTIDAPAPRNKSFADETVRFSFKGLIEKSDKGNPDQNVILTR